MLEGIRASAESLLGTGALQMRYGDPWERDGDAGHDPWERDEE